ncbi:DNA alkylation repair protein [Candidatus Merdisoma sp. JLR.KK006]|uniref:DNA alkylation repair protein n=1 Tax=Candidatus Merdisoma sp. JLR.KK006 TaxID=3112626 RepID=UPI002FF2F917
MSTTKEPDHSFTRESVRERLQELADPKYKEFQSKLLPGVDNVLGVRVPQLRSLAKEIARGDWETFLAENDREWYEHDMLQGLVIGCARMDFEKRLALTKDFISRINNWAVCDVFCGSLKETKKHKERTWEFLQPFLRSDQEYEIRFGVVMLLSHFVEKEYLERAFAVFDAITSEAYYVRMAVAWAVSVYFVHFQEESMDYLNHNQLDDWTYNKALQKITESYRVDGEIKAKIRSMKRKVM